MSKKKEEPVVEETANLPVSIEDQIRQQLTAQRGQLGALPSNKIGLKNKEFTLPDGQKSQGPLECIVLDFAWFLVHYPGVYNSNNPQQPDCFAVGRENPEAVENGLAPHESVKKPYHSNCKDCPKNEWKSAPTGNGKACKNQRRLVLVPPNFDETTEPMTMYVSPGGLKNWDKYVSRLNNEQGVLPVQVVTAISFDPDQTYPLLQFSLIDRHTRVQEAWALREQSQNLLFREIETKEDKAA
jgi:hypothetical protein